jgi:hypothetical protein
MSPEEEDPDLGYIIPSGVDGPMLWTVLRFVEKPDEPLAGVLIAAGPSNRISARGML